VGLPLICSDAVGAAHDLIEPGVNGAIVAVGEVDPLREAMQRLATDSALRQAWQAEAQKRACQWTPKEGARRWNDVIQTIIKDAA